MDVHVREVRPEDVQAIVGILNPIIEAGRFTALDTPLTFAPASALTSNGQEATERATSAPQRVLPRTRKMRGTEAQLAPSADPQN